ncbi:hypothetical protein MRX96_020482 [Rhipicephalus microplus]
MEIEARDPRTGAADSTKQKRAETNTQWRSPDSTLWRCPPTTIVRFVDRAKDGVRAQVVDWTGKHHVHVSSAWRAPLAQNIVALLLLLLRLLLLLVNETLGGCSSGAFI